jgi:hypothetical protein
LHTSEGTGAPPGGALGRPGAIAHPLARSTVEAWISTASWPTTAPPGTALVS